MTDYRYFGTYASFLPADKPSGELLQGADFLVGDVFDLVFRAEGAQGDAPRETDGASSAGEVAWVRNRFGGFAGALDAETSRTLRIMVVRGWTCKALLSFVAFTDAPDPGYYWGQVAIVCYAPEYAEAFDRWVEVLGEKMADGARIQVALTPSEVDKVIESGGEWLPAIRAEIPTPEVGKTAILKRSRSLSEKIVEQGRAQRPGCMVVGWAFNIVLITGVIALILHWVGVF